MKKFKSHDGADVEVEDLDFIEDERVAELDQRFSTTDAAETYGVMTGFAIDVSTPFVLSIGDGVGCDDLGQSPRLIVGDADPDQAAPFALSFAGGDINKLLTMGYATKNTTPVDNPETNTPEDSRVESYPTFHLRTSVPVPSLGQAHEIVLGTISAIDGSGNATFDLSTRQYWGARLTPQQNADIADGIKEARGHERRDHVSGIEAFGGDPGHLTIDSGPTPDELVVTNTVDGDSLLIDGHRIDAAAAFTNVRQKFTAGDGATDEAQLWAIWVGSDGVVGKTVAAQYPGPTSPPHDPNITGVQLVDVAPFNIPFPSPLVIEHFLALGSHFLRLNGQSPIAVVSSGQYYLRMDADPDTAVLVEVTVGALPATGTSGSPTTDTVTTFPDIFDAYGHGETLNMADGALLLGFVWWTGTGFNLLGTGTWHTTGTPRLRANQGNLDSHNVSDAFAQRLLNLLAETRVDGFTTPLAFQTSGLVFTPNSSTVDRVLYAYVGGFRVRVPFGTTITLPDNSSSVIYLASDNATSMWGQQIGVGARGVPLTGTNFMPVWNVITASGGVISVEDVSVTLKDVDKKTALVSAPVDHLDVKSKYEWMSFDLGTQTIRGYIDRNKNVSFTINAVWTRANFPNGWSKDQAGQNAQLLRLGVDGIQVAQRVSDAAWGDASWSEQASIGNTLELGLGFLSTALDAAFPRMTIPRALDATTPRTEVGFLPPSITGQAIRIYRSNRQGESYEFSFNAKWIATQWFIDDDSKQASIIRLGPKGISVAETIEPLFPATTPSPWNDDDTGWGIGDPHLQIYWGTDYDNTTAFKNTLTDSNFAKVVAKLNFDGSGSVAVDVGGGFNATASVQAGNTIRVTFAAPFATATGWAPFIMKDIITRVTTTASASLVLIYDVEIIPTAKTDTTLEFQLFHRPTGVKVQFDSGSGLNLIGSINVEAYGAQ